MPKYRNIHDRRMESLEVIKKVKELRDTHKLPEGNAINKLLEQLTEYIVSESKENKKILIEFPEMGKFIKGVMYCELDKQCVIKLEESYNKSKIR
jgi:hypothetical protein